MKWPGQAFECSGLTWNQFTKRLVEFLKLRAISDDRIVLLTANDRYLFVQFRADVSEGSLRCETISNQLLTQPDRLSKSTVAALMTLGWKPPTRRVRYFWRVYGPDTELSHPAVFAVRTLREAFKVPTPASLQVWCGAFSVGGLIPPPSETGIGLPILPKGAQLINLATGGVYRIVKKLGQGGFGAVYQAAQSVPAPKFPGKLCLKIAAHPEDWHREAYFGQLLQGVARAIAVYDSFAIQIERPEGQRVLYCLVSELAEHGDLVRYLRRSRTPWTEVRACREVSEILRVLVHLHEAGAVHRDLTPSNVLVAKGEHLKLGDFGIATHRLPGRSIPADVFNRAFAPPTVADGSTRSWRAPDDVYQIGVILAALLGGSVHERANSADVKALQCSPSLKAIIQRAIGDRPKRYEDAAAMLAAIEGRSKTAPVRSPIPTSVGGKVIVFTGRLTMTRPEASSLAKRSGATVQRKITSRTDIVVQGTRAKLWKADAKGQKLLDVDRERERGHDICVINEREFLTLAQRPNGERLPK